MTNDIVSFQFDGLRAGAIHIKGQPMFVASEWAELLGYRDAPRMTRMLDDDQKGTHIVGTLGGEQEVTVITESGLWTCIIRSRRPEAKAIMRWLTGEVLPALRRQGFYMMPGANLSRPLPVAELLRVAGALELTRDRHVRRMLSDRLDQIADSWGVARIAGPIGYEDPDFDEVLLEFWSAVRNLEEVGVTVNHSRGNGRIALHMASLATEFQRLDVPISIDHALRRALRGSTNPRFEAAKVVNCADGKYRACWVFDLTATPPPPSDLLAVT